VGFCGFCGFLVSRALGFAVCGVRCVGGGEMSV
jgi:hypothetical protein